MTESPSKKNIADQLSKIKPETITSQNKTQNKTENCPQKKDFIDPFHLSTSTKLVPKCFLNTSNQKRNVGVQEEFKLSEKVTDIKGFHPSEMEEILLTSNKYQLNPVYFDEALSYINRDWNFSENESTPNNKITFSVYDDVLIYHYLKNTEFKNDVIKLLEEIFCRTPVTIERRYNDMCMVANNDIEILTQMAFANPQKSKKMGIVYDRKNGMKVQVVTLAKKNYSNVPSEHLLKLKFDPNEIACIIGNAETFPEEESELFEKTNFAEPEKKTKRIKKSLKFEGFRHNKPKIDSQKEVPDNLCRKIKTVVAELFAGTTELTLYEKIALAHEGVFLLSSYVRDHLKKQNMVDYQPESDEENSFEDN